MVKKIGRFFIYVTFFILAIVYFSPKVGLYYFAEKGLKTFDVVISSETLNDRGFSLDIDNAVVLVKSIESAKIDKVVFNFLIFYNSITLDGIKLSSTVKSFLPLNIKNITVRYSILNPLNAVVYAQGDFGKLDGSVDILDRKVHLVLSPSKKMEKNYKNSLKNFKVSKNGELTYDKIF